MSVDQLKKLFEVSQYAFRVNVEGVTHDESLLQPGGGANCLNWAKLQDSDLAAPRGKQTLGEALHFLHFHESYHIGQTALLRRLAGKPGAIP